MALQGTQLGALEVDAGPDRSIKLDRDGLSARGALALEAQLMDGPSDPALLEVRWSARGPGDVEFLPSRNALNTFAVLEEPGAYTLTVKVEAGGEEVSDEIFVAINPRPVAYWRFDESEGTEAADAASIDDNGDPAGELPATVEMSEESGLPVWVPDGGKVNGALDFGGVTRVDGGRFAGASSSLTVGFWLNADGLRNAHLFNKFPDDASGRGWAAAINEEGSLQFLIGSAEDHTELTVKEAYVPGTWVQVFLSFNGPSVEEPERRVARMALDGVLQMPEARTVRLFTSESGDECMVQQTVENDDVNLFIGADQKFENAFAGRIDDVRVYRRALAPEQMTNLSVPPTPPFDIRLRAPRDSDAFARIEVSDLDDCDSHTFYMAAGSGAIHNSRFVVVEDHLIQRQAFLPPNGGTLSFRVGAVDSAGFRFEKVFTFVVEGTRVTPPGGGPGEGGNFNLFPEGSGQLQGARRPSTRWTLRWLQRTPTAGDCVATGRTTDADWSPYFLGFTHQLDGIDANLFTLVEGQSGRFDVLANAPLDFSDGRTYAIEIMATDAVGRTLRTDVTIAEVRVHLNEFLADNAGPIEDFDGRKSDWIEIYNETPAPVSAAGWTLTNDTQVRAMWAFPDDYVFAPNSYLIVFASGKDRLIDEESAPERQFHTNFTLRKDFCEYLALWPSPEANVPATEYRLLPRQRESISYGILMTEGETRRLAFDPPTPEAPNELSTSVSRVDRPDFSVGSGYYDGPVPLTIMSETEDAEIRVTFDGSEPDENSMLFVGPLTITGTAVVRARGFKEGLTPSNIRTHTYLFLADILTQPEMDATVVSGNEAALEHAFGQIPALSLVSAQGNFFGPKGVFSTADTGVTQPVDFELFGSGVPSRIASSAGLRVAGRSSVTGSDKRALRFVFRGAFGPSKLRAHFFGEHLADQFDNIDLRIAFNNAWVHPDAAQRVRAQNLRDAFARESQRAMGSLSPHSRFVHLFVNGVYWGVYFPTERPDDRFQTSYYGCVEEDFDTIDSGVVDDGGSEAREGWDRLRQLTEENALEDPDRYAEISGLVDLENFADFMLLHAWLGNQAVDLFPANGVEENNYFAGRHRDGLWGWRFFSWDSERTLEDVAVNTFTLPNRSRLLDALLASAEFRTLIADRAYVHFFNDGVLAPDAARARYAALADRIEPVVIAESARWGDQERPGQPYTDADWQAERQRLENTWFQSRTALVVRYMRAGGFYPDIDPPNIVATGSNELHVTMSSPVGDIYYTIDGVDPRAPGGAPDPAASRLVSSFFIDREVRIRARVLHNGAWSVLEDRTIGARRVPPTPDNLVVTELMYNSDMGANGDFIEFKNIGNETILLDALRLSDGVEFDFSRGEITELDPGDFVLVVDDSVQFHARYGPGLSVAGAYSRGFSNGGEDVALSLVDGRQILEFAYDDQVPWPTLADGAGFSLVVRSPESDPDLDRSESWRASSYIGGSPGDDDPELQIPTVLVNEVLVRPLAGDAPAIELYNPGDASAFIGGWYLSDTSDVPMKYRIPDDTVILANDYLVLRANETFQTFFTLGEVGSVILTSVDESGTLTGNSHEVVFGPAVAGVTFGLHVDSSGREQFPAQRVPSLGAPNAGPRVPSVVVNEIMYHPPDTFVDDDVLVPEQELEFVEIHNPTSAPVSVAGRMIHGGTAGIFRFPDLTLPAGGLLVVANADPGAFRKRHGVPASVPVLGPFDQNTPMSNREGRVSILTTTQIALEEIDYIDREPWPERADGAGRSLERFNPNEYGNDPANWRASCEHGGTPGRHRTMIFSDWKAIRFTAAQLSNPAISGDFADPNGNALVNLLEYAFGNLPTGTEPVVRYPRHELVEVEGVGTRLALTFPRRPRTSSDLDYVVESSRTLAAADWRAVPLTELVEFEVIDRGDGTEMVSMYWDTDVPDGFLRLSVSYLRDL